MKTYSRVENVLNQVNIDKKRGQISLNLITSPVKLYTQKQIKAIINLT